MWVVSGFPARHEASLPLVRFVPFMFLSQPQMKKYRCLWGMSIPNHNILCLSAIPGCQSQKPNVCPVESRNRMVRRGIRPLTCLGTCPGLTCPHALSRKKPSSTHQPRASLKPMPPSALKQGRNAVEIEVSSVQMWTTIPALRVPFPFPKNCHPDDRRRKDPRLFLETDPQAGSTRNPAAQ